MPGVGLVVNVSTATWTPQGGSVLTLTRVTSAAIDKGITNIFFSGDGDRLPTVRENVMEDPSITLQGGNLVQYLGLSAGVKGTVVIVLNDARNKTGTGAATFTMINSLVESTNATAQHAQFGTGSLAFSSCSSDGVTSPLSYAVAT